MQLQLTDISLSLRAITQNDEALLYAIYSSTRVEEMAGVKEWSDEQKDNFLRQQFIAQHTYYQQNYIGAAFWIIQKGEEPIGRLYVDEAFVDGSIRIIDITLLPAHRNSGTGKLILKDILEYAGQNKKPVTIHVESFNPAMQLYERLGFLLKDKKNGVHYLLEWKGELSKQKTL